MVSQDNEKVFWAGNACTARFRPSFSSKTLILSGHQTSTDTFMSRTGLPPTKKPCSLPIGLSPMQKWTFFCVTFGCKVNQYETEAIREAWVKGGGQECTSATYADVLLINSCAITARGERDARNALVKLKREAPSAILVLTGCAAKLVANFVPRKKAPRPEADLIFPQEEKEKLVTSAFINSLTSFLHSQPSGETLPAGNPLRELSSSHKAILAQDISQSPQECHSVTTLVSQNPKPPTQTTTIHWPSDGHRPYPQLSIAAYHRVRPVLKVQDGCTHRCTYCIVPLTRGPFVSRPPKEVIAEAERLMETHSEIILSGINLGQYGRDRPDFGTFWDLLERLDDFLSPRYAGKARLRISSLEPSQLHEQALRVLSHTKLVAPHLHISLQHASWRILRRMGRGHYTAQMLLESLIKIHDFWPVLGLGCDIIAGFPGETEEDVEKLCLFLKEAPVTYAHVFPYSRRPGTAASNFPNQLPHSEKIARARKIRAIVAGKSRTFWARLQQVTSMQLAADAEGSRTYSGYVHGVNEYYVPCFLPEKMTQMLPDKGFLSVRPAGLCPQGILVRPVGKK